MYRPEDDEGQISERGYDFWQLDGTSEDGGNIHLATQLRHRVQFRKGWRRADQSLYPVPTKASVS